MWLHCIVTLGFKLWFCLLLKTVVCCPITLLALQSCWRSTWTEPLLGLIPLYKQYPPAHFLTPHRSLAQSLHKQEHLKLPQYLLNTDESKKENLDKTRIIRFSFEDYLFHTYCVKIWIYQIHVPLALLKILNPFEWKDYKSF